MSSAPSFAVVRSPARRTQSSADRPEIPAWALDEQAFQAYMAGDSAVSGKTLSDELLDQRLFVAAREQARLGKALDSRVQYDILETQFQRALVAFERWEESNTPETEAAWARHRSSWSPHQRQELLYRSLREDHGPLFHAVLAGHEADLKKDDWGLLAGALFLDVEHQGLPALTIMTTVLRHVDWSNRLHAVVMVADQQGAPDYLRSLLDLASYRRIRSDDRPLWHAVWDVSPAGEAPVSPKPVQIDRLEVVLAHWIDRAERGDMPLEALDAADLRLKTTRTQLRLAALDAMALPSAPAMVPRSRRFRG